MAIAGIPPLVILWEIESKKSSLLLPTCKLLRSAPIPWQMSLIVCKDFGLWLIVMDPAALKTAGGSRGAENDPWKMRKYSRKWRIQYLAYATSIQKGYSTKKKLLFWIFSCAYTLCVLRIERKLLSNTPIKLLWSIPITNNCHALKFSRFFCGFPVFKCALRHWLNSNQHEKG